MYKKILPFFVLFLISCTPASQNIQNSKIRDIEDRYKLANSETKTMRADPRFIAWLEKSSLLRATSNYTRIVSGTSLGWRAPSTSPEKTNILKSSPVWFYANPWQFETSQGRTKFGEFLASDAVKILKKNAIQALFFSPTASFSLDKKIRLLNAQEDFVHSPQSFPKTSGTNILDSLDSVQSEDYHAITSFTIDNAIATNNQYAQLEQNQVLIGGSMLSPALGIGSDFLLALRAVREYSGLFMMTELPKNLWNKIPYGENEHGFSFHVIDMNEKNILIKEGLIPEIFARDFATDADKHGFAVTDPIRGTDSANRRWIYRFANSPYRPLLNMSDPNLNAHKLFSASIIQQIGILHQPLIGMNIGDLWGQESSYHNIHVTNNEEKDNLAFFAEPALFTLKIWNKSVHNYGAWSILQDSFPMEYIPILIEQNTDFVADTIFMPALEQSLLEANTKPLKDATKKALDLNIPFSSLWHASQDVYEKQNFANYFSMPNSMSLASTLAGLNSHEAKLLQKTYADNSLVHNTAMQDAIPKEVHEKYENVQKIQLLYTAFQALLPGLTFLSGQDVAGIIPYDFLPKSEKITDESSMEKNSNLEQKKDKTPNNYFLTYPLSKETAKQNMHAYSIRLNPFIEDQDKDEKSLLSRLNPFFTYRQKHQLSEANIVALLESDEDTFAILLQNPNNKYHILLLNISNKKTNSKFSWKNPERKIPKFYIANDRINHRSREIHANSFNFPMEPFSLRILELR